MSAVQNYQDAYRANEAARKAVAEKAKLISDISSGINYHLRSFLGFNFNISIDNVRERYDPKGRVNIDEWPSAAELKELFNTWNDADTAMRSAWSAIPEGDRVGLKPPPQDMSLPRSF